LEFNFSDTAKFYSTLCPQRPNKILKDSGVESAATPYIRTIVDILFQLHLLTTVLQAQAKQALAEPHFAVLEVSQLF
jgi:hypothetical protein